MTQTNEEPLMHYPGILKFYLKCKFSNFDEMPKFCNWGTILLSFLVSEMIWSQSDYNNQ